MTYKIRKDLLQLSEFLGTDSVEVPTPPVAPYAFTLIDKEAIPQAMVFRCKVDPHMRGKVETFLRDINACTGFRVFYQTGSMRANARETGRIVILRAGSDIGATIKAAERL